MSTSIPALPVEPTYAPSLTLFGSTGGCLLSTLQQLLLNPPPSNLPQQQITLLVRSQAKLTSLLTSAPYSVPSDLLTQPHLRIIEGDILTSPAETIVSTITTNIQGETPRVSDVILFAIGGYPKATLTPPFFDLENPDICRSAMERVLDAVRTAKTTHESSPQLGQFKKPLILAISSTGLYKSPEPRDLPIPLLPLYKILLRGAHRDKAAMEDLLTSSSSSSDPTSALCDSIVIRGALFNSNPPSDPSKPGFVKAGYAGRTSGSANAEGLRWGNVSGPAIGWGISRADLGRWIWEEVASGRVGWTSEGVYTSEWAGKKVSLTN